jgi:hypothetical protein
VGVTRGHERQAHALGQVDGEFHRLPLHIQAVVLNLDEIAVAEHAVEPGGVLAAARERFVGRVAAEQRAAQFARDAAAQADDAFVKFLQQFAIDPRLVVKAFQKRLAGELHQVLEPGAIGGQQREVKTRFALRAGAAIEAAARRDVRFVTDDRVDARIAAGGVKLQRAVEIAVVRDRQGVHAQLFGACDHGIDRAGAIQQAVVAMAMQMNKRRRGHGSLRLEERKAGGFTTETQRSQRRRKDLSLVLCHLKLVISERTNVE